MEFFEFSPPPEVPRSRHGIGTTRDFPAAKMLGSSREAELFRRLRTQAQNPGREPFGVHKLFRTQALSGLHQVWVTRILPVEAGYCSSEALRVGGHECLDVGSHNVGLIGTDEVW